GEGAGSGAQAPAGGPRLSLRRGVRCRAARSVRAPPARRGSRGLDPLRACRLGRAGLVAPRSGDRCVGAGLRTPAPRLRSRHLGTGRTSSGLSVLAWVCVVAGGAAEVLRTWLQPFASSVVRMAAPRLSTSRRHRYTGRAAFTVGDSMTVDLPGW